MTCRKHQLDDAIDAPGSLTASDRAVYHRRLKRTDHVTAVLPAKYTEPQAAVARAVGITVRQVQRAERHLAQHGWLVVTGATGPGRTRQYVLSLGSDCDCTGRVHDPQRTTPTGATHDTMSSERTTPTDDTSQVRGRAAQRGSEREGGKAMPEDQPDGDSRIRCAMCTASCEAGQGPLVHDPGCWTAAMWRLYESEAS